MFTERNISKYCDGNAVRQLRKAFCTSLFNDNDDLFQKYISSYLRFKEEVRKYAVDHTFKETAKKFGIHHSTVSGWVKESEKQDKCANFGDFFREKGEKIIFTGNENEIFSPSNAQASFNRARQ